MKNGTTRDLGITVKAPDGQPTWIAHPNEEVDLAAFGLNGELLRAVEADEPYVLSDTNCWRMNEMREQGLSEGDSIFVLGYPLGEVSRGLQRAIARAGIIARVRDSYDYIPSAYLIDAHIFEGNSGGPVVTRPELTHLPETKPINQCRLIGIVTHVHAYHARAEVLRADSSDRMKLDQKTQVRFKDPAGLARVEPIDRIFEMIEAFRRKSAS
jgi:hypothetical protein